MTNPEAIYDTLYIGSILSKKLDDFSMFEIQFFSYLACLLWIYEGKNLNDWHYRYIKSELGGPFSVEIQQSLQHLLANGYLDETSDSYYNLTERGEIQLKFYSSLVTIEPRIKYLDAACKSISILPYGVIKEAVFNDPVLSSARNSISNRLLLESDNPATKVLYSQLLKLKSALAGENDNLLIPALIWLESLNPATKPIED